MCDAVRCVVPAQAGTQFALSRTADLGPGLRRGDDPS